MKISGIPKPGTRVKIVTRNVIGHETEDTGTIMGRPFQDGFIRRESGQWTYQKMSEEDNACFKITIALDRDRGGHREAKSVPFRIDKILRLERVNGSK